MSLSEFRAEVNEAERVLQKRIDEGRSSERIRSAERRLENAKRKLALAEAHYSGGLGELAASGGYAFTTEEITRVSREPVEFTSPIASVEALPVVPAYADKEAYTRAKEAEYLGGEFADRARVEGQELQARRDKITAARLAEQERYRQTVTLEEELVREIRLERPKASADWITPLEDPGEAEARRQAGEIIATDSTVTAGYEYARGQPGLLDEPVIRPVADAGVKVDSAFKTLLFLGFLASAVGAVSKRR